MRRGLWFGLGFVALLTIVFYTALHHKTPDEFAAIKGQASSDEMRYYNAKDLGRLDAYLGAKAPKLSDIQVRYLHFSLDDATQVEQFVDALAKKRRWKSVRSVKKFLKIYSPSGARVMSGIEPQLSFTSQDMYGPFSSQHPAHRYHVTVMDSQVFTWWDQFKVRSEHGGTVKWTDPWTE